MADRGTPDASAWDRGWDSHRRTQLRRLAGLPLADKLAWLEDAQRLADRLRSQRPRQR